MDIEQLSEQFLKDGNCEKFIQAVLECNAPRFHNQVVKVFLWTLLEQDFRTMNYGQVLPMARELLDAIHHAKLLKREEFESAYRRLFYHLNDLQVSNEKAYEVLVDFGEYSVDNEQISKELLTSLKQQSEFAKDALRIKRLKQQINTIIDELFSDGDIKEAKRCIKEMNIGFYAQDVVKMIISRALDGDNRVRDLTSKFLAAAIGDGMEDAIHRDSAQMGFVMLLQRVEQLYKDVPDVIQLLSQFLARAIVDECIEPSFLDKVHLLETDMGYAVIHHCRKMLIGGAKARERLFDIWGASCNKSLAEIKEEIHEIVKTLLKSHELNETIESIKGLNVPDFHHEIVKQLVPMTAEFSTNETKTTKCRVAAELIVTCVDNNIIAIEQVSKGFERVRARLNDLKLDIPHIDWFYNKIALEIDGIPLCGVASK